MRVTAPLWFPMNRRKMRALSWQRWRKVVIKGDGLEDELREAGIQVVDANEYVKKDSPTYFDYDAIEDPAPIFPKPPALDSTHPNWHEEPCRFFTNNCFPIEGLSQAEVFTKSVQVKKGLPSRIVELGNSTQLEKQDQMVERVIRHAFLWDAYLERLPKLRDLEIPSFSFKRQYGIPLQRSNKHMILNLLRLCEVAFPAGIGQNIIGTEQELEVNLEREGFPIKFKVDIMATLLSKNLLPKFEDPSVTLDKKIVDIFPFGPTANFEEQHIYEGKEFWSNQPGSPFPFIQTTFISHHLPGSHTHLHPRWNNDRYAGSSALFNFATALHMARRKYGNDVKELPEPITTQGVHFTGKEFQFSVFQLNTLDIDNADANTLKNILWITDKIKIFEACHVDRGIGVLDGYNPEVFKLLMGMYAAGLNTS